MTAPWDLRVGHRPTPLQGWVIIGGLVVAALVTAAIVVPAPDPFLPGVKWGSAILLFVAALLAPRRHPALSWVVAAFGASALGDLFLVGLVPLDGGLSRMVGMGLFAVAYGLLTVAFWRGRFVAYGLRYLATYVLVGVALVFGLWPRLEGVMQVALPAFTLVIVVMAWSAATSPARGVFSRRVGELFAVGAGTLVASDAAVSFAMFAPPTGEAQLALDVFIRLSYFAGWLVLLVALLDPEPSASGTAGTDGEATYPWSA